MRAQRFSLVVPVRSVANVRYWHKADMRPPEPETGLKTPRMDGRYVTKRAKTDKGRGAYIAPSSINPAMARRGDA